MDNREADIERRRRHAWQPVLAAGVSRERVELDEEKDFRNRHGDHGKIDAGASERDQAHQITDDAGGDHADNQRRRYVWEVHHCEQIGRNHAAGAEEGGLAE